MQSTSKTFHVSHGIVYPQLRLQTAVVLKAQSFQISGADLSFQRQIAAVIHPLFILAVMSKFVSNSKQSSCQISLSKIFLGKISTTFLCPCHQSKLIVWLHLQELDKEKRMLLNA